MANPRGPYPGRQLFLGLTLDKRMCAAYLVTGRSKESRERKAVIAGSGIRIGPLGNTPYDALRHYTAVRFDESGIIAISNGIQTDAVFEVYKLLNNVQSSLSTDYMVKIMDGANSEPDSLHTPRLSAVGIQQNPAFLAISIKTFEKPAAAVKIEPQPGFLTGVSTYRGELENPQAADPSAEFPRLNFSGKTAAELAGSLYDISNAQYKSQDIRVCALGLIYNAEKLFWETSIINARE